MVSPGEVDIEERSPVASPAAAAEAGDDAPSASDAQPPQPQQQQAQEEQQEEPTPTPSPQTPVRPAGAPSVRAMPQSAPPTPAPAQAAAAAQQQHQRQHSGQQQPQSTQQITPPRSATQPSSLQGTPLKPPVSYRYPCFGQLIACIGPRWLQSDCAVFVRVMHLSELHDIVDLPASRDAVGSNR